MPGYFLVSEYPNRAEHPFDIAFQLSKEAKGKIPPDQSALKSEVEKTLDVLRTMFAPESIKFHRYFDELLALSRYGLVADTAQPVQAMDTLRNLQKRMFDQEKGTAISVHMKAIILSQATFLACIAAAMLIVAAVIWYFGGEAPLYFLPLAAVIPGLFVGVVFSSFVRCRTVEFYDLSAIEADRFTPFMKIAFAIITLALAGAFLKAELIEIAIGKVRLSAFDKDALSAFVFGAFVGVAQEAVISRIESIKQRLVTDPRAHGGRRRTKRAGAPELE